MWKQNTMQVFYWTRAFLVKLDGYRAVAFKAAGRVHLRSRNASDFAVKYPAILKALAPMPDDTVIDGEIVALDERGRPSFSSLQNHGSSTHWLYYVFDVMVTAGKDVTAQPPEVRRDLLRRLVLPMLADPIRETPELEAPMPDLIQPVKAQGLQRLVAKRRDSRCEPGRRSGA
jgi:ATP-dependent DNA ligase